MSDSKRPPRAPPPVDAPLLEAHLLEQVVELPVVERPAGGVEVVAQPTWFARAKRILGPLVAAALFGVAILTLNHLLHEYSLDDVLLELRAVPVWRIVAASAVTVLAYGVLAFYDFLGLAYAERRVRPWTVILTSFIAYAFAHSTGFNVVVGTALRARLYGRAGLNAVDVAKVVSIQSTALWLGAFAIVGAILIFVPDDLAPVLPLSALLARLLGVALIAAVVLWIVLCFRARRSFRIGPVVLALPSGRLAIAQLGVSCLDWLVLSWILRILLPAHTAHYSLVVAAVVTSTFIALVSHVPGGLGVFESLVGAILADAVAPPTLLSALLLMRVLYYIVPFVIGIGAFALTEVFARRRRLSAPETRAPPLLEG